MKTPIGFINNGRSYIFAAKALAHGANLRGFISPIDQCLGIGLELIFKGTLAAKRDKDGSKKWREDGLKKLGHNLHLLFDVADTDFLGLKKNTENHVRAFWKSHLRDLRDEKEKQVSQYFDVSDAEIRELFEIPSNEEIGSALVSFQKCLTFLNQGYALNDHYRYFEARHEERIKLRSLPNHFDMIRESLIVGAMEIARLAEGFAESAEQIKS